MPNGSIAEDKTHQWQECYRVIESFLYFVLNYCWIENKETSEPIRFTLWDSQRAILDKFLDAYRLVILKARQLGLTWMCAAYSVWLCITKPLQLIVVISAKEDWAIEFLDRCKFILDRLPAWLYPPVGKRTGQILEFNHLDDKGHPLISQIKSLATTPEGAQSKTPTLLILDETARNRYIKEIWASSKPGIDAAGGRIILISNSIKDGVGWSWTRDIYTRSMQGVNDFVRIFMPWWDRPGRGQDFLKRQVNEGMDAEDVSQHYPATEEEAISSLLGSYFGKVLTRHTSTMKGIKGRLIKDRGEYVFEQESKGVLEIWRFPYFLAEGYDNIRWKHRYAIGSDVSEGLGQSYSVAYVYDRLTQEIVARLRSNRIDAYTWANMVYQLSQYYENALICAERTGAGQTTIKRLREVRANQYVQLVPDSRGNIVSRKFGWGESQQSKHELCGDLKQWLRSVKGDVYCAVLLDEAATFIRHENGTLGHEEGKLDDCVMAAGCMVQADQFVGRRPEQIDPGPDGWLKRWQEGEL